MARGKSGLRGRPRVEGGQGGAPPSIVTPSLRDGKMVIRLPDVVSGRKLVPSVAHVTLLPYELCAILSVRELRLDTSKLPLAGA